MQKYSSTTKDIALCALLSAVGIVARVVTGNGTPIVTTTAIIILCAAHFGLLQALAVDFVTVMVSSVMLGFGIWVPFQLAGWGIVAMLAWLLFRRHSQNGDIIYLLCLIGFAIFAGYIYGAFLDIYGFRALTAAGSEDMTYKVYWMASLPMTTMHALSNAVFCWFLTPLFRKLKP